MSRQWLIIIGAFALIPLALFVIASLLSVNVDGILTEAHDRIGFPPEATNIAWGNVPDYVEGPELMGLPVTFDLPQDTDPAEVLAFYRDRCETLDARIYQDGPDPGSDRFSTGICTFRVADRHRLILSLDLNCEELACRAVQTISLAN